MATQTKTTTPIRDEAYAFFSGIWEEAWDDLHNSDCSDDAKWDTGWCPRCTELQARMDEVSPILRQLEYATEEEAEAILAAADFWAHVKAAGLRRAAA